MYPTFAENQGISDAADNQPSPTSIDLHDLLYQLQIPAIPLPWQTTTPHQIPNIQIYPPQGHSVTALPSPPSANLQFQELPYNGVSSMLTSSAMSEHIGVAASQGYHPMGFRRHSMLELHQMQPGATLMQGEGLPQTDNVLGLGMPSVNVDWQHYSAAFVTPSLQSSGSPSTAFKTIGPDTLSAPSPQSVQSPQLGLHAQEQCNSEMSASSHRAHLGQMFPLAESQSAHASWLPDAASASAHCPDVNPLSQYGDVTGSAHSVVLARTPIETPTPDEQLAAACASTREASPSTATCGGRRRARGLQKASQSASMVFSPEAQRALQEVLIRIQKHPYPDPPTIRQLEEKYGLSTKQVRNWFALRRFRHMYTTEHEGIKIWHFRRNAL